MKKSTFESLFMFSTLIITAFAGLFAFSGCSDGSDSGRRGGNHKSKHACVEEASLTEEQKTIYQRLRKEHIPSRRGGRGGSGEQTITKEQKQNQREVFHQKALDTVPNLTEEQKTALKECWNKKREETA